ncbi:DUF4188 domain-containing protein [Terrabacter sp. AAH1]|jgi:hypothetical protein
MTGFAHSTHTHDGDLAVFLIGMRVNQPWRPDLWLPVLGAMPGMIAELYRAKAAAARGDGPDLGFLEARTLIGSGGPTVVQYWRDAQSIYAYANDPERLHRPAWTAFYRRSRKATGAVGIWHETYAVPAGAHESLYVAMPPTGLGKAFGTTDQRARRSHARLTRRAAAS